MNFKFPKSEKLSSEKEIDALFRSNGKFTTYPFRVLWQQNEKKTNQILISCPKRRHKKATDRNLVKRRMREAYRLNKQPLIDHCISNNQYFNIGFVYIGNEIHNFSVIEQNLKKVIEQLTEELA